jgi:Domain of unknown function (DUF4442)
VLTLAQETGMRAIVTKLSIEFFKKARGIIVASATVNLADFKAADTHVKVFTDLVDSTGTVVAKVEALWVISEAKTVKG